LLLTWNILQIKISISKSNTSKTLLSHIFYKFLELISLKDRCGNEKCQNTSILKSAIIAFQDDFLPCFPYTSLKNTCHIWVCSLRGILLEYVLKILQIYKSCKYFSIKFHTYNIICILHVFKLNNF
jgi:hypothetical protein